MDKKLEDLAANLGRMAGLLACDSRYNPFLSVNSRLADLWEQSREAALKERLLFRLPPRKEN